MRECCQISYHSFFRLTPTGERLKTVPREVRKVALMPPNWPPSRYPSPPHRAVSTYGQALEAQLAQLKAAGCGKIYREKVSGAQADRKDLQRMLKALASGDAVTVTRIDRLARSTFDLFAIVKRIVVSVARPPHGFSRVECA
jgi:Resolvase, N terminal domain